MFKILNGYENIDRNMFFSLKIGYQEVLVLTDGQINEWNKLSTGCITA